MSEFQMGEIWHGKVGTAYENVTATIQEITVRNVQVVFDQVVSVDDVQLGGKVFTQKQFRRHFERGQQLSLFE